MRSDPGALAGVGGSAQARQPAIFCRHGAAVWRSPLERRELRAGLSAMCAAAAALGRPLAGVELYLVSDAVMARANMRHMGCTGPTNVLSFPGGAGMPGTLLLSLDTLDRECLLYGQKPREHLLRLLAHGMGHLAGLDHGPEMDALCAALEAAAEAVLAP